MAHKVKIKRPCPINPGVSTERFLSARRNKVKDAPKLYYALCDLLLAFDKAAPAKEVIQREAHLEVIDDELFPPQHKSSCIELMRTGLRRLQYAENCFWRALDNANWGVWDGDIKD